MVEFKVRHGVRLPKSDAPPPRRGFGFPWDDLEPGTEPGDKGSTFYVPREFWIERGEAAAHLNTAEGQAEVKNRIKRAFFDWKKGDPSRAGLYAVVVHDPGPGGKFLGSLCYLVTKAKNPAKRKARK